jgi:hypothetical protein
MSERKIVTQIGSLPYDDVENAVEYSLRHDIPFLPELPKLGDAMMEYIEKPGTLSCLDTFKEKVQDYETVKIQCVGPATLILAGYDQDDAISKTCQHIDSIINGLNVKEIILFLDEPALGHAGFDYKQLWSALFESFDVIPGVHVCGNMNWDDLFQSEIQIISFDASQYDITKYPGYRNGKKIAWGIKTKEDARDFQEGDLLTLPCGMGPKFYSTDDCEVNLNNMLDISNNLTS